jgi:hypothetical protein
MTSAASQSQRSSAPPMKSKRASGLSHRNAKASIAGRTPKPHHAAAKAASMRT